MKRRSFLAFLSGLPFLGFLRPQGTGGMITSVEVVEIARCGLHSIDRLISPKGKLTMRWRGSCDINTDYASLMSKMPPPHDGFVRTEHRWEPIADKMILFEILDTEI